MKKYSRFCVLAIIFVAVVGSVLFVPSIRVQSQDGASTLTATLVRNKDSLVILITATESSTPNVSLRDVQFNLQPSNTTIRFDKFESAFGLNFDALAVPACLRLQRDNAEGPYPSDCSAGNVRRYSIPVSDADIFWYDKENGRNFTLNILGADGASSDCSTSQTDCSFDISIVKKAAAIATVGAGPTALPTGNSIVFVRNYDLYVVDRSGKNERRLTSTPNIKEEFPSFSHSGNYIVYRAIANGESNGKIYRMNADGTGSTRLTTGSSADWIPTYSPDDTQILYRSVVNGVGQIWVMNADGSKPHNLTGAASTDNLEPDWSPDGKNIVFSSNRTGKYEIWMMDEDGQNPQQVTNNTSGDYTPTWSPDGKYIAFMSDVGGTGYDLYIIQLGTADTHGNRITFSPGLTNREPHWSPDGQFIVYAAKVNSRDYGLFIINREGKGDPNPITLGWEASWGNGQPQ